MSAMDETRLSPVGDLLLPGNNPAIGVAANTRPRQPSSAIPSLLDLSKRLRPRDYVIAALLDEHLVLTTTQLAAILFGSEITCQHRLQTLRRIKVIDRFVRNQPGRPHPLCWVPGPLGAALGAASRQEKPPTLKALQQRHARILSSSNLDHLLGVNGFFIRLLAHARRHDGTRLARWWSERATAGTFGQRINPDGHGVWTTGTSSTGFFLEYDRGTEALGRLLNKLPAYRRLHSDGGPGYPVLFVLHSRAREQHLHRKLAAGVDPGVPVATTSPESGHDPAAQVWRLFGNGRARYTLAGLAKYCQPGREDSPLDPGPPADDDDPVRGLR